MNDKPTCYHSWAPMLIVVSVVIGACAGVATPPASLVAVATPPHTATPAFWPTGAPKPTRGPSVAKRARPGTWGLWQYVPTGQQADCLQIGGRWEQPFCDLYGGEPWYCFDVPTTDAGRPCTDSSECEGWCDPNLTWEAAEVLVRTAPETLMTGTCSRIAGLYGQRYVELHEGKVYAGEEICK